MAGLTFTEFQDGFARVAIDGVKRIYTSANVKVEFQPRDLPALLPDPIRPLDVSNSQVKTLGNASGRRWWKRTRVMNYVCLVAAVGEGRAPASVAERAALLADAVENALCDFAMDGLADVGPVVIRDFGTLDDAVSASLPDSTALKFYGFTIQVQTLTGYHKDF